MEGQGGKYIQAETNMARPDLWVSVSRPYHSIDKTRPAPGAEPDDVKTDADIQTICRVLKAPQLAATQAAHLKGAMFGRAW